MYTVKKGVALFVSPEVEKIMEVICLVFNAFKLPVVITSGLDGPHHREDSLHYCFRAVDIRKIYGVGSFDATYQANKKEILESIDFKARERNYPIVVIDETDHLHVEWNDGTEP